MYNPLNGPQSREDYFNERRETFAKFQDINFVVVIIIVVVVMMVVVVVVEIYIIIKNKIVRERDTFILDSTYTKIYHL